MAACAALCFASAATAEIDPEAIRAFNAAQAGNDATKIKAAAVNLSKEVLANPDDVQAANAGFEAAWTLCRLGACAQALETAKLSASIPAGDDGIAQPTRNLLVAYAAWKSDPSKSNASALDSALEAAVPAPASALSVTAFRDRYGAAIARKETRLARDLTKQAATHFASAGPIAQQLALEARLLNTSLDFTLKPNLKQQEGMIRLIGEARRLQSLQGEEATDGLETIRWYAEAWSMSIGAYFNSSGRPSISDEKQGAILSEYTKDLPPEPAETGEQSDDGVRLCKGHLDMTPPMAYPKGAAAKGMFGSVIVRFSVNNGAIKSPEVLASVPDEGFKDKAVEILSKWRYVPDEDPAKANCDLQGNNVVLPVVFEIR